ncbi:hypothetical protein [Aliarcobacter butzleri]|uniref:Uncharacterized protein n=1 Tax=Aliarcobacter butzleri TaxID=28197 RepID=A0AAW7PSZ9_9BACT|nr:hypothetical protein [Aliarcobacter butzleri]MCG3658331.1 hypothetical protein [Aliarcobacter butzleri]MCG3699495.1 hypothetical protein [Aliarcobacter butzleri]MDN5064540.1 hypothetical protein [Aliarcobacter butzleri]MDN5065990.1 hypothetical protein [Aliarcobacter butzleri]MDN5082988.1 hypothetical protein [Aliarcobacter butzleri]
MLKKDIKKELATINIFLLKLNQMDNNRRLNKLKQLLLKIKEIFMTDLEKAKKIVEEDGLMLFYILINRTIKKELKC